MRGGVAGGVQGGVVGGLKGGADLRGECLPPDPCTVSRTHHPPMGWWAAECGEAHWPPVRPTAACGAALRPMKWVVRESRMWKFQGSVEVPRAP